MDFHCDLSPSSAWTAARIRPPYSPVTNIQNFHWKCQQTISVWTAHASQAVRFLYSLTLISTISDRIHGMSEISTSRCFDFESFCPTHHHCVIFLTCGRRICIQENRRQSRSPILDIELCFSFMQMCGEFFNNSKTVLCKCSFS